MRFWTLLLILVAAPLFPASYVTAEELPERNSTEGVVSSSPFKVTLEPGSPVKSSDGCSATEIEPNSMSPTWDTQAETVPCGALETDNLFVRQPLGSGVAQQTMTTTVKYGLAPRLEVRWVPPGRESQAGGGTPRLGGTTDQWLGALYRFHDQGRWMPDLAFDYAFKIPTANPAKGFGSGYADHTLTFIASRDLGLNHVDLNVVGTIAGAVGGATERPSLERPSRDCSLRGFWERSKPLAGPSREPRTDTERYLRAAPGVSVRGSPSMAA